MSYSSFAFYYDGLTRNVPYEKLAEEDGVLRQKAENREDEDTLYILDTREAGEVLGLVVYEIDGYYVGVRE